MKTTPLVLLCATLVAGAAAACDDPLKDAARFTVTNLEIADARTSLVWYRCPGLANPAGCDERTPLPSETWSVSREPPPWLPKRRSAWRLASAAELDTIAASGCKYLISPKHIDVMFDSVWTRDEVSGGKVLRYGVDRKRIESPKDIKGKDYAQAVYVRDGP
jgi:hypothetical protein